MSQVRILASTFVPFRTTTVRMSNLAPFETKRITMQNCELSSKQVRDVNCNCNDPSLFLFFRPSPSPCYACLLSIRNIPFSSCTPLLYSVDHSIFPILGLAAIIPHVSTLVPQGPQLACSQHHYSDKITDPLHRYKRLDHRPVGYV